MSWDSQRKVLLWSFKSEKQLSRNKDTLKDSEWNCHHLLTKHSFFSVLLHLMKAVSDISKSAAFHCSVSFLHVSTLLKKKTKYTLQIYAIKTSEKYWWYDDPALRGAHAGCSIKNALYAIHINIYNA